MSTDKKKRLGDDPFANKSLGGLDMLIGSTTDGARDLNVKETPSKPKRGRPTEIKRDITKTSQSGLREGLTRATFIIREDTLDKLKERAYTDRKKLKDLVTEALDYYLDNHKETKLRMSEGDFMKLWIGAGLIIIGGIYIGGTLIQNEIEQTKQDNSVALCVSGYTGNDESNKDWRRLSTLSTEQASRESGVRESVIDDCLNRWDR